MKNAGSRENANARVKQCRSRHQRQPADRHESEEQRKNPQHTVNCVRLQIGGDGDDDDACIASFAFVRRWNQVPTYLVFFSLSLHSPESFLHCYYDYCYSDSLFPSHIFFFSLFSSFCFHFCYVSFFKSLSLHVCFCHLRTYFCTFCACQTCSLFLHFFFLLSIFVIYQLFL